MSKEIEERRERDNIVAIHLRCGVKEDENFEVIRVEIEFVMLIAMLSFLFRKCGKTGELENGGLVS